MASSNNPEDPEGSLAKRLGEALAGILRSVESDAERSLMGLSGDEADRLTFILETTVSPHTSESGGFALLFDDDAEFSVYAFYERVTEMFLAVHGAMDARDVTNVTHFLSPGALASIRARILGTPAEPPAGKLSVTLCRALSVRREGGQHIVHIRIVAESAQCGIVSEYWTLIRDVGARSKAGATIMRCPNCGAPIDGPNRMRCSYCEQQLCDPALDWVVDEIRPEAE